MVNFDIDEQEIIQIKAVTDLSSKRVLEIGCGSGRLTKQLAPYCSSITAIEPDQDAIAANSASNIYGNVTYQVADSLDLPFNDSQFDIVIFSLSLCCVEPVDQMRVAVLEAARVLKSGGLLFNLMPSTVRNFDAGYMWYYVDEGSLSQVCDMDVVSARMALKQIVFNEHKLTFVEERRVHTRWSYNDTDEMHEKWLDRYNAFHCEKKKPDHRTKFIIQLEKFLDNMALVFDISEEMQILKK